MIHVNIRLVITPLWIVLLLASLFSCSEMWGSMDDPADPKSDNYQGYPTVDNPAKLELISDWDGTGTPLFICSKVLNATVYALEVAEDPAFSYVVYSKGFLNSNTFDAPDLVDNLIHQTTYWWRMRASLTQDTPWSAAKCFTVNKVGAIPFVSVPAGTFQRDYMVTNTSTVSAFHMSAREITRAQFNAIMETDPSDRDFSSGSSDPIQMVNWYHAIAFCNKLSISEGLVLVYSVTEVNFSTLTYINIPTSTDTAWDAASADWSANGYRLPTEMEWMWAAMGATAGSTGYLKAFAGSTGTNTISDYVWYYLNSDYVTHSAGTKLPNELGLYDMSGNVREWNWDWYGSLPLGVLTDYRGADSGEGRVLRGGSWDNEEYFARVNARLHFYPYHGDIWSGFRIVRL